MNQTRFNITQTNDKRQNKNINSCLISNLKKRRRAQVLTEEKLNIKINQKKNMQNDINENTILNNSLFF